MNPIEPPGHVPASGHWRRLWQRVRAYLPDVAAFFGALLAAGVAALLTGSLGGCGGGVGTEGTGSFASGSISGFGSIVVNGVHFDESSARVEDEDGLLQNRSALALGMVVQVSAGPLGSAADGTPVATATLVRSSRALQGTLTAVDAGLSRLVLLGQRVQLSADTVVDPRLVGGLAGLLPGQWLEVYGFYDAAAAAYAASRIAPAARSDSYRVSGPVAAVDAVRKTFTIGSQTYRYDQVAQPAGLDNGALLNLVLQPAPDGNGRWLVSAQSTPAPAPQERDGAELHGRVSALLSASRFVVDGVTVDASGATVSGTLQAGAQVAVSGALRGGVLVAGKVSVEPAGKLKTYELRGTVQTLDLAGRRLVLRDGVRDTAVSLARADLVFDKGRLSDLAVGRRVRVQGLLSADRTLVEATQVRFDD